MHPDILRLHAAIEEDHWWFVARRRIIRELLEAVEPPGRGKSLLDLGCGTGGNLGDLCDAYSGIGVELDEDAVSFAAERYPHCRFTCGSVYDIETWNLTTPVDACLIMDVLEHLDDDRAAVENAVRTLRPGGHLLVTVPADPALWSRHDRHHEHRRRYTADSLSDLLAGLPVERRLLSAFNARLYPPIKAWRWLRNRIGWLAERGTTGDLSLPPPIANRLLTRLFMGELPRLRSALDRDDRGFVHGVSLLAIYRRHEESS